ncbi:MAG: SPW repeat domain-containing protein, partial [Ardenticatenaceae bacterium]
LGIWLMAAPAVLGYGDPAQSNDRVIGPLVAAIGVIAISGVTRELRWINLLLGLWLLVAPWVLGYDAGIVIFNSMASGLVIAALATVRGSVEQRMGGGWSSLWASGQMGKDTRVPEGGSEAPLRGGGKQ